jgi:hypothetical protein
MIYSHTAGGLQMTGHLSFEVMYTVQTSGCTDNDMSTMEIRNVSGISEAREIAIGYAEDMNSAYIDKTYTIHEIVNIF